MCFCREVKNNGMGFLKAAMIHSDYLLHNNNSTILGFRFPEGKKENQVPVPGWNKALQNKWQNITTTAALPEMTFWEESLQHETILLVYPNLAIWLGHELQKTKSHNATMCTTNLELSRFVWMTHENFWDTWQQQQLRMSHSISSLSW